MRIEAEEATRLLEKDIHEKQDTLVSLRQQLQDIKQLNIQLYATSEVTNFFSFPGIALVLKELLRVVRK